MSYQILNSAEIEKTAQKLLNRIRERFPTAGLTKVCEELCQVIQASKQRCEEIRKPNIPLRVSTFSIIIVILLTLIYSITTLDNTTANKFTFHEFIQSVEAGIQSLVYIGALILFLITVEIRIKRNRTLKILNYLRSMAHVIDMHQLSKDPDRIIKRGSATASSPKHNHIADSFSLTRYLDYCSEMLAIVGKVAALYAQNFNDSVILGAVNEIEDLSTGLARKIWQKIMIIHSLEQHRNPPTLEAPSRTEKIVPQTPLKTNTPPADLQQKS